jgi:hypothetical protein
MAKAAEAPAARRASKRHWAIESVARVASDLKTATKAVERFAEALEIGLGKENAHHEGQ